MYQESTHVYAYKVMNCSWLSLHNYEVSHTCHVLLYMKELQFEQKLKGFFLKCSN